MYRHSQARERGKCQKRPSIKAKETYYTDIKWMYRHSQGIYGAFGAHKWDAQVKETCY